MDTGKGEFVQGTKTELKALNQKTNPQDWFSVGEEIQLKGSRFRITAIGNKFVRLQILPQLKVEESNQ